MLVWFSVTPIGTGSPSVADEVAAAIEAVEATGVTHTTDASGTLVEGDWEACMAALKAAVDAVLATGAMRASVTAKIDVRVDEPGRSGADKLASLRAAREARAARDVRGSDAS